MTCAWPIKKDRERRVAVAERPMLRGISGVMRLDRISYGRIQGTTKALEISRKVHGRKLK